MIERVEANDRIDQALAAEPMDPIDMNEPIDPMENALPTEPMEQIELVEPIERNDPLDRHDHFDGRGRCAITIRSWGQIPLATSAASSSDLSVHQNSPSSPTSPFATTCHHIVEPSSLADGV